MIGYTTVGSNDLTRAGSFYDALFESLGARRLFEGDTFIAWGRDMQSPGFSVAKPFDGNPATRQRILCGVLSRPRRQQAKRVLPGEGLAWTASRYPQPFSDRSWA